MIDSISSNASGVVFDTVDPSQRTPSLIAKTMCTRVVGKLSLSMFSVEGTLSSAYSFLYRTFMGINAGLHIYHLVPIDRAEGLTDLNIIDYTGPQVTG